MIPIYRSTRSSFYCSRSPYLPPNLMVARRSFCIKKINNCATIIFGDFLILDDLNKLDLLRKCAWQEYKQVAAREEFKKINPNEKNIEEAKNIEEGEEIFQALIEILPPPLGIPKASPGVISLDDFTVQFWSSLNHHTVRAPFKQHTSQSIHIDKDKALDMLSKLIEERKIKLQDDILILAKGCDNNEAAVKLRLFIAIELKKRTYMIATDINYNALCMTRGLDLLVQENLAKMNEPSFPPANIIARDTLNREDPLIIKNMIGQKIALLFRLTAITPLQKIKDLISDVIKNNDICVMHFFEDASLTIDAFNTRRYHNRVEEEIDGVQISYYLTNNKKMNLIVWKQDALAKFIDKQQGRILKMSQINANNDHGEGSSFFVCIVEKK